MLHRRIPVLNVLCGVAVLGTLTLTGCSGSDSPVGATTPTSLPAISTSASSTDEAPVEPVIRISEYAFSGVTEVSVGTTVTIVNDDTVEHTWSSYDGLFDSGRIQPGDTFEFTFDEAGTFAYGCNLHGGMSGVITVSA